MKLATFFCLALLSLVGAAPAQDDDKIIVTEEMFPDSLAVYSGQHDIVSITVPLNGVNFEDDESLNDDNSDIIAFFVEADVNEKGEYDYKGLYELKGSKATKILETGTDSAADNTDSHNVFLSATDGVYVYKSDVKKVEKYGSFSDNYVGIVKANSSEDVLVLSADHVLYRIYENGEKKEVVNEVKGAHKIVLDFTDNLYFYGADKQPYVVTETGVLKIEGLPANPSYVALVKPPFVIEDGVIFISDDKSYIIYANGTSELDDFVLQVKPTAYAMEATLFQYYAYNKKIYEYNILVLLLGNILEEIKKFLEDKSDEIESIATRSRGGLKV